MKGFSDHFHWAGFPSRKAPSTLACCGRPAREDAAEPQPGDDRGQTFLQVAAGLLPPRKDARLQPDSCWVVPQARLGKSISVTFA